MSLLLLFLITPLNFAHAQFASDGKMDPRTTAGIILEGIQINDPANDCPECGLDAFTLQKGIDKTKAKITEISKNMNGYVGGRDRSKLSEISLAHTAEDQIRILELEVRRQKMIAQLNSLKFEACRKTNSTPSTLNNKTNAGSAQ